jgi:hypothetical protein
VLLLLHQQTLLRRRARDDRVSELTSRRRPILARQPRAVRIRTAPGGGSTGASREPPATSENGNLAVCFVGARRGQARLAPGARPRAGVFLPRCALRAAWGRAPRAGALGNDRWKETARAPSTDAVGASPALRAQRAPAPASRLGLGGSGSTPASGKACSSFMLTSSTMRSPGRSSISRRSGCALGCSRRT